MKMETNNISYQIIKYTFLSMMVIYVFFIIGICIGTIYPEKMEWLISHQENAATTAGVYGENNKINFLPLFLNNVILAIALMLSGIVPYIYLPVLAAGFNAYIIGSSYGYATHYLTLLELIKNSTHVIIEFIAISIATALGIYICNDSIKKCIHKRKNEICDTSYKNIIKICCCLIFPLLLVASIFESLYL